MSLESNSKRRERGETGVPNAEHGDADPGVVRVRVSSRRRFEAADFEPSQDKFKDVIVLPACVADRLFPGDATTGYVRASAPDSDQTVTLYALRFADAHESDADPTPDAYLRQNVRRRIDRLPEHEASTLELESVPGQESGALRVVRFSTRTESTRGDECRVHPSVLETIDVDDGDEIECYNPETGGRLRGNVRAEPELGTDEISLGTRSRKLLRVEIASRVSDDICRTVRLRTPVQTTSTTVDDTGPIARLREAGARVTDRLCDTAVGYHEIRLRVILGLNTDEGRGIARVNRETMRVLGIDDGDRVDIVGDHAPRTVQCYEITPDSHLIETDEDFDTTDIKDRVILLPATEREAAGALCDDVVRVRRNTGHVAVRSIVPSMFGFLGVFVGGLQTITLLLSPELYRPAVSVVVLLSLAAVWLVLWPERQRCQ